MNVLTLTLGAFATNCYLLWENGKTEAMLIDCAGKPEQILRPARERGLEIKNIAISHGHIDHVESLTELKKQTDALVAIYRLDAPLLSDALLSGAVAFGFSQQDTRADQQLEEGDVLTLEGTVIKLSVLHTPGHTPGSICLLGDGVLFSGDCLFAGGIGRMDLPGGDEEAMINSLSRLMALDSHLCVYPGHGPATTIGKEREHNPWLGELQPGS